MKQQCSINGNYMKDRRISGWVELTVELWHLFPSHESEPFTEGFMFKRPAKEIRSDRFLLFDHGISDSSRPIGLRKNGVSVPFILWS